MAWDEGQAQLLRDDLAGQPVVEKRMFGGLAFLIGGHMVCGIHKGGVMLRVGKEGYGAALALPGTGPLQMGGRVMAGMIGADAALIADDARRGQLLALALACVAALPPKPGAKPGAKLAPKLAAKLAPKLVKPAKTR